MWLKKAATAGHDIAETELAAHYYKMRLFNKVRPTGEMRHAMCVAPSSLASLICFTLSPSTVSRLFNGQPWSASPSRMPQTRVSGSFPTTSAPRERPPVGTWLGATSAALVWMRNLQP